MQRLKDKRLIQKEAALLPGLIIRQIKRLWQKYQKQDVVKGLISKRRGKASNNRSDADVTQKVLELIKNKYSVILAHR